MNARNILDELDIFIQIRLDNEWETSICYTKILDMIYNYRFFNISYFGLKIDAFFRLQPDSGIEIPREINLGSDDTMSIKFSLEVQTYYPVFELLSDDYEICDNDSEIDWDFLDIPRPDGSSLKNSDGALKRVYWYHNLLDKKTKEEIIEEKEQNRQNEINNME